MQLHVPAQHDAQRPGAQGLAQRRILEVSDDQLLVQAAQRQKIGTAGGQAGAGDGRLVLPSRRLGIGQPALAGMRRERPGWQAGDAAIFHAVVLHGAGGTGKFRLDRHQPHRVEQRAGVSDAIGRHLHHGIDDQADGKGKRHQRIGAGKVEAGERCAQDRGRWLCREAIQQGAAGTAHGGARRGAAQPGMRWDHQFQQLAASRVGSVQQRQEGVHAMAVRVTESRQQGTGQHRPSNRASAAGRVAGQGLVVWPATNQPWGLAQLQTSAVCPGPQGWSWFGRDQAAGVTSGLPRRRLFARGRASGLAKGFQSNLDGRQGHQLGSLARFTRADLGSSRPSVQRAA